MCYKYFPSYSTSKLLISKSLSAVIMPKLTLTYYYMTLNPIIVHNNQCDDDVVYNRRSSSRNFGI